MIKDEVDFDTFNKTNGIGWWIYDERAWLINMIAFHRRTLAWFEQQLAAYETRIARWENYLKTGH